MRFNIESIYNDFIGRRNDVNYLNRYLGNEHWYNASSSGGCSRKLYYKSIDKLPSDMENKKDSNRTLRLGTIMHNDIQRALMEMTSEEQLVHNIESISVEGELMLESLNVRGFYDIVIVMTDGSVHLVDIKSMGSFPWQKRFGIKRNRQPSNGRYEMQLGIYGQALKEKYGRIDSLALWFWNKDKSQVREEMVPLSWIEKSVAWWEDLAKQHKVGLPPFRMGVSPVESWECNYCPFKETCQPPQYPFNK